MIPGRSSSWILQSLWWITPGMHVSVVNSYDAASDFVVVNVERIVDLPTDGKPMSATRASPTFSTSKPSPAPPPAFGVSSSAVRSFASRARSEQRCDIVALFTCVRAISFSMSRIFSTVVMVAGAIPWESGASAAAAGPHDRAPSSLELAQVAQPAPWYR